MLQGGRGFSRGLQRYWWLLSTLELTFWGWLGLRSLLSVQELCIAMISDLEHKTPIHHTVSGLEAAMREVSMVQVLHALGWTR